MSLSAKQITNCSNAIATALSVVRRPMPLPCSEWADRHFYMSPESSYVEGPWTTRPYQRVPLNLMGNDAVEELDIMKSARIGYTKMLMACMAYKAAHKKRNQIVYLPTDSAAGDFMKGHIETMLRDVAAMRPLCSWLGKKSPSNTRDNKVFDNRRQLWCLGGTSGKNFREKSVDDVYIDELDGFDENVDGKEGRPDHLARKRNEGSYFPKMVCGSTPTTEHKSLIYTRIQHADVLLRCYIPCPHCKEFQYLEFDQLQCIEPKNPATVEYFCKGCGASFDYATAQQVQEDCYYADKDSGVWTRNGLEFFTSDNKPRPAPRHVALHLWSAYSPFTTWEAIMRDFFLRKSNPVELQTWVNQTKGEPFRNRGQVPDWKRLYDRCRGSEFKRNELASWVSLITCGVDKQDNRLELEVVGWGRGKRSQSIDYRVLVGDTMSQGAGTPWEALTRMIMSETWEHPSGARLPIAVTAIDSGDDTQTVYNYCRQFAQPQVVPIKGSDRQQTIVNIPKGVDVNERGKKIRRGVMLWTLGVSLLKAELYLLLRQDRPTEESGDPLPDGWCDFPEYSEEYFRMLCAEQLVTKKNRRGYNTHEWEKIRERNEALDCRNYARAAASIKGMDRWTDDDWTAIEGALGLMTRPAKATAGNDTQEVNGVVFRRRSSFWD